MTFGEMKATIRRKLNEASATFWTDTDIEDAINEAVEEFADATEYLERYANVAMLTGRTYFDLTSVLPDTFLSPRRIWNTETHEWLEPTSARDLDEHKYVQWELVTGPPEEYFLRGNWWLGVFPASSNDTVKLRVYFTAIPDEMTESTDTPDFPREFHPGVVDLALSDLMAQSRETKKALALWASGQTHIEGLHKHVDGRQRVAKRSVL